MFGRSSPTPQRASGGFGNFLFRNAILLVITFGISFYFAGQIIQYFGFVVMPLSQFAGALVPQANDPFWVSYILIYALLQLFVMFFRYKTGSRI